MMYVGASFGNCMTTSHELGMQDELHTSCDQLLKLFNLLVTLLILFLNPSVPPSPNTWKTSRCWVNYEQSTNDKSFDKNSETL